MAPRNRAARQQWDAKALLDPLACLPDTLSYITIQPDIGLGWPLKRWQNDNMNILSITYPNKDKGIYWSKLIFTTELIYEDKTIETGSPTLHAYWGVKLAKGLKLGKQPVYWGVEEAGVRAAMPENLGHFPKFGEQADRLLPFNVFIRFQRDFIKDKCD